MCFRIACTVLKWQGHTARYRAFNAAIALVAGFEHGTRFSSGYAASNQAVNVQVPQLRIVGRIFYLPAGPFG